MMCLLKLLLSGCCVSRAWERSAGSDLALVFLLPSLQEHKGQLDPCVRGLNTITSPGGW